MKERIRTLMTNAGLTQQDFALRLEISAASLSNIFNGKTNPTNTHVCAVHKAFPNVNINWLLFGEGEMFLDEVQAGGLSESGLSEADTNLIEKKCDKPLRKVKEIRVFYDDGTYESFIPTVK